MNHHDDRSILIHLTILFIIRFWYLYQFIDYIYSLLTILYIYVLYIWGFPGSSAINNLPAMQETLMGLTPGLGRFPREGNDNPLQYSCLGNLKDRGAWQATAHEVAKKVRHDLATKQQVSPYTTNVHKKAQRADS